MLTTVVYIGLAWLIGACTLKDAAGWIPSAAAGAVNATLNNNNTVNATAAVSTNSTVTAGQSLGVDWCTPDCKYGLLNDVQVIRTPYPM